MPSIMSVRKFLPVLLVAFFGLGVLGFILATGGRPGEEIEQAAILHVREKLAGMNRTEGKDFTIGEVEILSKPGQKAIVAVPLESTVKDVPPHFLLELDETGGEWSVREDLRELFSRIATGKEFVSAVGDRLSRLYAERYRIGVTIREGTPFTVGVERTGKEVMGTFEFRFSIARSDGKHDRGVYSERFKYDGEEWVRQGRGQLLESYAPR